jgi:2-polyprenyl-6-methoxyphenol hydroxylase-like FAD-dependent oxidoreductase
MRGGQGLDPESFGAAPVLIVGAGPVGLTLALALRRLGVASRIIDAGTGPTPEGESRALGVQARTMEVFEALEVSRPLLDRGQPILGAIASWGRRPRFDMDLESLASETAFPLILSVPQGVTERILIDRLGSLGGQVEWETSLTDLRQGEGGVLATISPPEGEPTEERFAWLVGCDGARSTVRERLGLRFEGASYPERFLLADVTLDWSMHHDRAHLMIAPEGLIPAIPLPGARSWRLIDTTDRLDSDEPAAIVERFARLLRDHAPDLRARLIDAHWTSSFRVHRRAVDRLRVGRCFVAGDAAHIHSPVGGQGMNTGVQDAFNLAWKLALVVSGQASESLLDTYDAERRPVAEAVLAATDRATRLITLRNPLARRVRNLAVSFLVTLPSVRRRLARGVAELGISYRGGPLSVDGPAWIRGGDRLPDVRLDSSSRLHDLTRGPWFTLLVLTGTRPLPDAAWDELRACLDQVSRRFEGLVAPIVIVGSDPLAGGFAQAPIDDREGRLHRRLGVSEPEHLLIRPDGYVGERARSLDPARIVGYLQSVVGLGGSVGG